MNFYDSHAHLASDEIFPIYKEVLTKAISQNVTRILNICTDQKTLLRGCEIAQENKFVQNSAATTPHDVEKEGDYFFPIVRSYAEEKKLVAIGETGLDYFYEHSSRSVQQKFLVKYLHLAAEKNLPVIFHCREAFNDLFTIADLEYPKNAKAVLHCFTGTEKEAEKVLERGWFLSFSGIITFKKSQELKQVASIVPLSQMLIETDSPYLAPLSKRGTQNEPANVVEIASSIAQIKNQSLETIANQTFQNAIQLFS